MLWFYVGLRIFANPFANVFQKVLTQRRTPAIFIVFATHAILSLVCVPILFIEPLPTHIEFWLDITASAMLAVAGNGFLIQAVKLSDLSVLGPVNSYKAVVSILPGILLLHELPTLPALAGVLLIVAGSYFVVDPRRETPLLDSFASAACSFDCWHSFWPRRKRSSSNVPSWRRVRQRRSLCGACWERSSRCRSSCYLANRRCSNIADSYGRIT